MFKLLAKASEYLAPNLKAEEELFLQWHNLVKELKRRSGSPTSVEETEIPLRLQWVFNLLQEDSGCASAEALAGPQLDRGIGPCLEFALRYKIFDWLVALAEQDKPSGLKSYVLFFLSNFVRAPSTASLLSKSFLYKPLARLAECCGSSRCSPWDREEMAFLQAIVDVIEKEPCLGNLFLKSSLPDPVDRLDADLKSLVVLPDNPFLADGQSAVAENSTLNGGLLVAINDTPGHSSEDSFRGKEKFTFPLLNSLLRTALNPDPVVSSQARAATVTVLRSREPVVCGSIAESGVLNSTLISHLRKLYLSIPATSEATDILLHNASGDLEHVVRSYTQWVTFIDQVLLAADQKVALSFHDAAKRDLTEGAGFAEDWSSNCQKKNDLALAVMVRTYKTADSPALLSILSDVLLDRKIFAKFLNFFSQLNDLNLLAFDLLDLLIQKPTFRFVEEAFLRYLDSRIYIRKDQRMQDGHCTTSDLAEAADRAAMFRDLFPTTAKSCTATEEDKDCDSYVRESHYSMTRIIQRCKDLKWPPVGPLKSCNVLLAEESSFFDGQPFNEGPLLRVLFTHLNNLLSQSYVLNLRVTGALSKICLIPHASLREYLLDPTVPLSAQCTSLYRCLVNLVQKMDAAAKEVVDFREKLVRMRQSIRNGQWSEKTLTAEDVFLCGVITLEEFCKEIAARTSVRFSEPVDK